jgi:UPF0716 protein FxsA
LFIRLFLLFVLTPLAELSLLVYLGTVIGPWYTILIVVATGALGAYLARNQGLAALARIRSSFQQGTVPSRELFEGALILAGGLLLLTPGVITDAAGFLVLIPPSRRAIASYLLALVRRRIQRGEIHYWEMR